MIFAKSGRNPKMNPKILISRDKSWDMVSLGAVLVSFALFYLYCGIHAGVRQTLFVFTIRDPHGSPKGPKGRWMRQPEGNSFK